jgi:hypothetical protein
VEKIKSLSILIIAFAIFFYAVIIPAIKFNQENKNKTNVSICLGQVQEEYLKSWNIRCWSNGYEANCLLPTTLSKDLEQRRQQNINNCYLYYK